MEINDLIDNAIANAVARRELVETLSAEEATSVAGGLTVAETSTKLTISRPIIAGFIKPIEPICPPPIKPIKPIKPICPPIVVGLIYKPDQELPLA